MGRFISPDPWLGSMDLSNPQSLNRYAYVLNNPLSFVDPNGLDCAYLNASGSAAEEVDHDTTEGECAENGGYYAPGHFNKGDVNTFSYTDQVTIQSYQQGSGWLNTTSNCEQCSTRNADGSLMGAMYMSNGANLSLSFNATMGSGMTPLDDPTLNPLGRAIIGRVAQQTAPVVKGLNCAAAGAAPFSPYPIPLDAGGMSGTAKAGASDFAKDKATDSIKETIEKGGTEFAERGAAAMSIFKYAQAAYESYKGMKEAGCLGGHE